MPRFLNRLGLAFVVLMTSNAWALGLGEIKLNSALNEPFEAEIELLSATPEELAELTVKLASSDAFARYGLDRPAYLQGLTFDIVEVGRADGNYVRVTSRQPMTEPFLTFLVEASWARGRLLREYTVLLDPPTFAPPQPTQQAVTAPQRAEPRDSGRIERPAPQPAAQPAPRPQPVARPRPAPQEPVPQEPAPAPDTDTRPYDTGSADDYIVSRNQTLWGIARSVKPDSRLTINQTMLAIFEANPEAFGGNINILKAGARLRIPSADEIYQIDRRTALNEVSRQHENWDGTAGTAAEPAYTAEPEPELVPEPEPEQPSLTLVPPDEEPVGIGTGEEDAAGEEPMTREQAILERLEELEAAEVPEQQALIDIRNDELSNLREELRQIRGEPPLEVPATDDPFVDGADELGVEMTDEPIAETVDEPEPAEAEPAEAEEPAPANVIRSAPQEPGFVEKTLDLLQSFWMIIVGAIVAVAGILFFFLRRRGADDEGSGVWEPLDAGDDDLTALTRTSQTETIPAPEGDEAFVVVEQEATATGNIGDTIEVPPPEGSADFDLPGDDQLAETGSLEDTFSSETAVNLDQSDPIAEADFHMAYGLYDQAADLINGALEVEPERQDLLTKLCEIYFVWGNRDSFVDAAERVKSAVGDGESAEWDKIVIMGQQIAADHALFAGAGVAGATREVDLTFDAADDGGGDLDMVFGDDETTAGEDEGGLDFLFDESGSSEVDEVLDVTQESPTIENPIDEGTAEMPALDEDATIDAAMAEDEQPSDATAEIDLDDLGLDLDALDAGGADEAEMEITGSHEALGDDTDINKILPDLEDETGKNPAIDPSATGLTATIDVSDLEATGLQETVEVDLGDHDSTDADVDILAATGKTQILSDDMAVETINEPGQIIGDEAETLLASNMDDLDDMGTGTEVISDSDATILAPVGGDEDFDFAKTEALPKDAFDADATAETPALASTDMDLDLDDLTAVLEATEGGDTVEMPREDETVEQPRPAVDDATAEVPTMSFSDDDMSDDLSEARTMTEVGTKLDLARAYVDMGDPGGARSILEEVLDEGDDEQRQQAQQLLDSLPS
ncbi:MAG: FimV/HubP family polar landmark protein [Woeseiaceae bacterium]|nr:FimV/HubP family polar landmark protein [Woeseiaceae bacterium]